MRDSTATVVSVETLRTLRNRLSGGHLWAQIDAVRAIRSLALHERNRPLIHSEDIIQPLAALLNSIDQNLIRHTAGAIRNLSENESCRNIIREANVAQQIVHLLNTSSDKIKRKLIQATAFLVVDEDMRADLKEAGIIDNLLALLRSRDEDVIRSALISIKFYVKAPQLDARLSDSSVVEAVRLLYYRYQDNRIKQEATFLLHELVKHEETQSFFSGHVIALFHNICRRYASYPPSTPILNAANNSLIILNLHTISSPGFERIIPAVKHLFLCSDKDKVIIEKESDIEFWIHTLSMFVKLVPNDGPNGAAGYNGQSIQYNIVIINTIIGLINKVVDNSPEYQDTVLLALYSLPERKKNYFIKWLNTELKGNRVSWVTTSAPMLTRGGEVEHHRNSWVTHRINYAAAKQFLEYLLYGSGEANALERARERKAELLKQKAELHADDMYAGGGGGGGGGAKGERKEEANGLGHQMLLSSLFSNIDPDELVEHAASSQESRAITTWQGSHIMIDQVSSSQHPIKRSELHKRLDTLYNLHHPNLVEIFGAVETPDMVRVVMPCYEVSLFKWLSDSTQFDWTPRHAFAMDTANAMAFLHKHNVIYGQLTSSCVFVQPMYRDGNIALKAMVSGMQSSISADQPNDIFALAVVLYEIASDSISWPEQGAGDMISMWLRQNQYPKTNKTVPKGYISVMQKCWDARASNHPSIPHILEEVGKAHAPGST